MDKEYDSVTISLKDGETVLEYKASGKLLYTHRTTKVNFEDGCTLTLDFSTPPDARQWLETQHEDVKRYINGR